MAYTQFDFKAMNAALDEAKYAFDLNEVPVGAVLCLNEKIIATAHNLVETNKDATCHAEILCLKKGTKLLGDWRLIDCTLYVTMEPCSMCAGAAILSRIKKIVWGCPDYRHGASGSWIDTLHREHPIHQINIEKGLMEEEARSLVQEFFQKRRKEKKCQKETSENCS